jgi:hypothetical protein
LLSNAVAKALNFCVKLTQERLELEIQMSSIPSSQFDAKLFLLASRVQLEVKHVLVPFLDCLHEFNPKRAHMILVLMFDLKFKGLSIVSNYVKKQIATIAATKYDFETLIPLLCLTYQKLNVFVMPSTNYVAQ